MSKGITQYDATAGGVTFRAYLDKNTGTVTNFHPKQGLSMQELFGQPYDDSDVYRVVKGCFDRMYNDGEFIKSIGCIVRKSGFSTGGAYCNFPDMESPFEEEHFEALRVGILWGALALRRTWAYSAADNPKHTCRHTPYWRSSSDSKLLRI